jgi:hypothetical protein
MSLMRRKYLEGRAAAQSSGYTTGNNFGFLNTREAVLRKQFQCCAETVKPMMRDHEETHRRRIIGLAECTDEAREYEKPTNITNHCVVYKNVSSMSEGERMERKIYGRTCLKEDEIYSVKQC